MKAYFSLSTKIRIAFLCLLPLGLPIAGQTIQTYAGGGTGDGRAAKSIKLSVISGLARDAAGNLYLAEGDVNRVRRIDATTGTISTVAGNGGRGFGGDNGPATAAVLDSPTGVAFDADGNLVIADAGNSRVRLVDSATGLIRTVAGGGSPADNLGDGGPATAASLGAPRGIAFDRNGDLYIADSSYDRHHIRKVSRATGVITTVAGSTGLGDGFAGDGGLATSARMSSPLALVVDAAFNIYIADAGNARIRKVDAVTKLITTIAGNGTTEFAGDGGPATSASLFYPSGITLDGSGRHVLVSDTYHGRVRRVDADTGLITTIVGNGSYGGGDGLPATQAGLINPRGLVLDPSGALFIAAETIRRVAPGTTIISTIAGGGSYIGDDGPATAAILGYPQGIAVDSTGDLFIADLFNNRVRRVSAATKTMTTYAGNGGIYFNANDLPATATAVGFPRGLSVDAADNLYIADPFNGLVFRVARVTGLSKVVAGGGTPADGLGDGGAATAAALTPYGVAVDSVGNVFIADQAHHRIRKVEAQTGIIRTIAGIDGTGTEGGFSGDGGPAAAARLSYPHSLVFDAAGDLTFSDLGNFAVRKITISSGIIQTIAGRGNPADGVGDGNLATAAFVRAPQQIAFDGSGNLLIAETGSNVIRKVDRSTKVISTIVGRGTPGFFGDGGSPRTALLHTPVGVAVDTAGNIFIGDSYNQRVRIVPVNGGCPVPSIFSQTASQTIVSGQATVLAVFANGTGAVTYQWYQGAAGDVSRPVTGAVSASFTTAPLTQTTSFWVRIKDGCGQADSTTVTVTVSGSLADLSLTMSASASPIAVGTRLTFTLTARNNGPTTATGVTVTDTLPGGAAFVSVQTTQGTCSGTSSVVCAIGGLVPGAEVTMLIAVIPGQIGLFSNRARVAANEPDPNPNDNPAGFDVTVTSATAADVAVDQSSAPDPVRVGQPLTYTIFVSNSGPAAATAVVLTDILPSGVTLNSVQAQQGTCSGTTTLQCALGSLVAGGSTTVTIVVTPLILANVTNVARIVAFEQDPTSYNNESSRTTNVLSNVAACPALAPTILSSPDGIVRAGDTFTISWSDVYGPTDPNGLYRAQLASASDFGSGSIVAETSTRNLVTSYPTQPGTNTTLFFRIASIAGCGQAGTPSPTETINVAPNPPSIIVTQEQEPEWVVLPNAAPPTGTLRFKNVGGSAVPVQFRASGGFFTFSPTTTLLQAGQEVVVTVTALAGSTANIGTASGGLSAETVQGSISGSVVLSVTSTSTPDGVVGVDQDEVLIRIPRLTSAAAGRARRADPLPVVTVKNSGRLPIFLVPSLSPGGAWLKLDPSDFATPLAVGATRTIRLATDPSRITAADFPLPIWTVLSVSAAGAFQKTQVKIFYGDTPAVLSGKGRGFLPTGTSSFIIPTAVHKEGAGGTTFTSDGWLRNLSPDPVAFDVFVTPSGQDGQLSASRVQQTIPGFATLRLFDFIQGLFGSTDLAGPAELRSSDASQLSVRVNASGLPGNGDISSRYGTEIPVYGSGTGTGTGLPPLVLTGIKSNAAFRLNLILSETVGTSATVLLKLYDSAGALLASKQVAVPAAGNTQFPLLDTLGLSGTQLEAGSLSVEPAGGSGRVVAIGTLIDNASSSFQSLSGRALRPEVLASAAATARGERQPLALAPIPRVIPSIVHSKGIGAYFTTEVSITNPTGSPATLHLVYDYSGSDGAGNGISGSATADITLAARASLVASKSRDAIVNLFGLPADSNTAGPMRIEGAGVNQIAARATVTTPVDLTDSTKGLKGSEFQSFSSFSPEAVGLERTPVVTYPGIQKYPGIRTNLILAEVAGKAATVRLRIVDGTSGGVLAQIEKTLAPYERRQINDIWNGSGGFDVGSASFDRIAISLEPTGSGGGSVVGALSVIDNLTNSSRILTLAPPGPPQPSWIGF